MPTHILKRLWLPAVLVLYAVLALSTLVGERGLLHLRDLHQEQRTLEAEAVTLVRENEELRSRIARLQTDDVFFEKVVREELGFVKEGEFVYRFRGASPNSGQ
jgi:cell division protein FtsB